MPEEINPLHFDPEPMPLEEFKRRELASFAKKFVILGFVTLVITLILIPWGQM